MPRYALAADGLGAALKALQRVGRGASVDGMPACLAPAGLRVAGSGRGCSLPAGPSDVFAPPCEGCALRERCPGVPTGYLARFGAGELKPALASASTA